MSECVCFFFFFKQKTAYEMRISDWSSDVCSSDLQSACPSSVSLKNQDQEAPMWLIPRNTDGTRAGRIALPAPVREALVRWYVGQGSRADEEAGIMLVQPARIGERRIACDRLSADAPPPILTPAFLSDAETSYLSLLTPVNTPQNRAERKSTR